VTGFAWLVLAVAGAVGLLGLMVYDRRLLRRRIHALLRWIDASLVGNGHITGLRWVSDTELDVPVRMRSPQFRQARFHISFTPHPLLRRLASCFRSEPKVTVDFITDLDSMPTFGMEMGTLRYFARSRPKLDTAGAGWAFVSSQPLVLTTKLEWQREITGAFEALLASDYRDGISVTFQQRSPHFRAAFPLESAELDAEPCKHLLRVLMSVAEGASQKAS
jgi:hypothetical protein